MPFGRPGSQEKLGYVQIQATWFESMVSRWLVFLLQQSLIS